MNLFAPSGTKYSSFDQALENIFPLNNIDLEKTGCYILPPHFQYQMTEICDENMGNSMKNRLGDFGEHLVFRALKKYGEIFSGSLIAIHGLRVDDKNRMLFEKLGIVSGTKSSKKNFEIDFIVGRYFPDRKFGDLTLIEVKTSFDNDAQNLTDKSSRKRYDSGVKRLKQYGQILSDLCTANTDYRLNEESIFRALVCPSTFGIEKFHETKNLPEIEVMMGEKVNRKIKTKPCYDPENFDSSTSSICEWFLEHLPNDKNDNLDANRQIPEQQFFRYFQILIFMKTSVVVPHPKGENEFQLSDYSPAAFIMREAEKVNTADITASPTAPESRRRNLHKSSDLCETSELAEFPSETNIVLLTPGQQNVWECQSNRLSIMGYASTGKTILVLAKTIQLCKRGEKVAIIAPAPYVPAYKMKLRSLNDKKVSASASVYSNEDLFDCFSRSIFDHKNWHESILEKIFDLLQTSFSHDETAFWSNLNNLLDSSSGFKILHDMLLETHVFWDDIMIVPRFDPLSSLHARIVTVLALVNKISNNRLLWLLFDPLQRPHNESEFMSEWFSQFDFNSHVNENENDYFGRLLTIAKSYYQQGRGIVTAENIDWDGSIILFSFILRHFTERIGFRSFELTQSMRQSEEAFRSTLSAFNLYSNVPLGFLTCAIFWGPKRLHGRKALFPPYYSAHKIQGTISEYRDDTPSWKNYAGIVNYVIGILENKFWQNIPWSDVAVLGVSNMELIRDAFAREMKIPCLSAKLGYQKSLVVDYAWNVPSFEWPIVVVLCKDLFLLNRDYPKKQNYYMCLSRCQSWLIEIHLK